MTVSEPSEARRGFIDDLQLGFKTQNPMDVTGDDFGYVFAFWPESLFKNSELLLIVPATPEQSSQELIVLPMVVSFFNLV